MSLPKISPQTHWVLLVLFAVGIFGLIMMPILLMGYPYDVTNTIRYIRILVETKEVTDTSTHMLLMILSTLHPLIAWENVTGWVAVGTAAFCASLLPLWWCIQMLYDRRTAWIATAVFALFPLSWVMARSVGGYGFALFPLFMCFGTFMKFHTKRPWLAIVLSGIFFGMTMGIQHSYLAFLPWFALAYLWQQRATLLPALIRVGVFCAMTYGIFLLPMVPNAFRQDLTPMGTALEILSPMKQVKAGEGHLYPDEFIYNNYKEEYDEEMRERVAGSSFLKRQEDRNYRISFGTDEFNLFDRFSTGIWMTLNNIPQFFMMDFMGGVFLWLLIIPGIAVTWRTNRALVLYIAGLIFTMEFILRFVLLFTSSHLSNYLFALAMFAGVGAVSIITKTTKRQVLAAFLITALVCAQLVQANRKVLARLYSRSNTTRVYAATEYLKTIPEDSVIASPRQNYLFILSDRKYVEVHPKTIDFLVERGKLAEPFAELGITHIVGYSQEDEEAILRVARVEVIDLSDTAKPELSTFTRYLLNMVR